MVFKLGAKYRVADPKHIAKVSGVIFEQDQIITCSDVYDEGETLACKEGNFMGRTAWAPNEITPKGWQLAGKEELDNGSLVLVE